ncbi:MAG TPA: preprotein translocase subunit SecE [Acidimicrobiales bacterium]|nr:preprotein translocase subunit SecE [Acidimicrobiales bacterium]
MTQPSNDDQVGAQQSARVMEVPSERSNTRSTPASYLRETRSELRKVAWPSRDEVVNYSAVVLLTLVILVGFIFALNLGFGRAVSALFGT